VIVVIALSEYEWLAAGGAALQLAGFVGAITVALKALGVFVAVRESLSASARALLAELRAPSPKPVFLSASMSVGATLHAVVVTGDTELERAINQLRQELRQELDALKEQQEERLSALSIELDKQAERAADERSALAIREAVAGVAFAFGTGLTLASVLVR